MQDVIEREDLANKNMRTATMAQWVCQDRVNYFPTPSTVANIEPGFYDIYQHQTGFFFHKLVLKTDGLLRLPDSVTDRVLKEVDTFWAQEEVFRTHQLTYKRGILLYGPPGSGKSTTMQMVIENVASRGGVAIKFDDPSAFIPAFRTIRDIHPKIPIVVLMEDLDTIMYNRRQTDILNILDGVEGVDKVIFLATTNYPENLEPRVANRPSRFDRRFEVPYPSPSDREKYLLFISKGVEIKDLPRWVEDTVDMSLAHVKELFISTVILGGNYEETLAILRGMGKKASSQDSKDKMGFRRKKAPPSFLGQLAEDSE